MIRRKDGRWRKSITINGKVKTFYSSADTEKKADREISQQMIAFTQKIERGRTFEEVAREWETYTYDNVTVGTLRSYKPSAEDLIGRFGNMRCSEITAQSVSAYFHYLAIKGFSAKTIANRRSVLNLIIKYAIASGDMQSNPITNITIPKGRKKECRRALTTEERQSIVENKNNGYWGRWAYFTMFTGCRRGESFALTYGDIDEENLTVHIHSTVEYLGNVGRIKNQTKTEAGMRVVPITAEILSLIGKGKKTDLIFPDPIKGGIITNMHITDGWDAYKRTVSLEEVTPHMLRHTYATILYDADVDIKSAQYLMGHADISTTMKIYTHLTNERKALASQKVREKLVNFI